jgi:hypothetical protein
MFDPEMDVVEAHVLFEMSLINVNSAGTAVAPAEFEEVEPAQLFGG